MKTVGLWGFLFLLLVAIVLALVANHRTSQPQKVAQNQLNRVEMMAIDEIIETDNIVYNVWMGRNCYAPHPDATYTYANSCAFLTASGTLGCWAVEYANDYYNNPACYYRIQAQLHNQTFNIWQCGSIRNTDFDDWWGPSTWAFQSRSLPQTGNATQDVLSLAAIMSNSQGFVFTEWSQQDTTADGHVWALPHIMLHQHGSGQDVTYSVDFEMIDPQLENDIVITSSSSCSCEQFLDRFIDVQKCYVY